MSFRNRTGTALRDLIESKGDREAADIVVQAIESGKLAPEDFSIKELWEACERDSDGHVRDIQEAVASGSFPQITGSLINAKVIAGYESFVGIGDQLVTTVPSNLKEETVVGFTAPETPEIVPDRKVRYYSE